MLLVSFWEALLYSLPPKVWGEGTFSKKSFSWLQGRGWRVTNFESKFLGPLFYMGGATNDQVIPMGEDFRKMFSNLNTVNLKVFPNYIAIFT